MKKHLGILLLLGLIFSLTAFSATVPSENTGTASEQVNADLSELYGETAVRRGINILTGTKEPLTGESFDSLAVKIDSGKGVLSAVKNPDNEKDTVIRWLLPEDANADYFYMIVPFGSDLGSLVGHNHLYIAFDYDKAVSEEGKYTDKKAFWIMGARAVPADSIQSFSVDYSKGRQSYGKIVDALSLNQTGSPVSSTYCHRLVFTSQTTASDTADVMYYFDNMIVAPAYKVTYYSADGKNVVKTDYIAADEDGNLLTSFTPSEFSAGLTTYAGWASEVGGVPVTSIALTADNNKDIVLYATRESYAFDGAYIELDGKLDKIDKSVIASAALSGKPEIDVSKISWSSSNSDVVSVEKNTDGTATLTALSQGNAVITFSYADTEVKTLTRTVTVATEPCVLDFASAQQTEITADTFAYDYITVKAENSSQLDGKLEFTFVMDKTSVKAEITVPAETKKRDFFLQLPLLEGWQGCIEKITLSQTGDGITVYGTKLYPTLNVNPSYTFSNDVTYLTSAGQEIDLKALFVCELEGVYDTSYTWSIKDDDDVVSYRVMADNTLKIRAKAKTGVATVTVTGNDKNSPVSVSRDIYVGVDESKYGYYIDFLEQTSGALEFGTYYNDVFLMKNTNGVHHTTADFTTDGNLKVTYTKNTATSGGIRFINTSAPASQKYLVITLSEDSTADNCITVYYKTDKETGFDNNRKCWAYISEFVSNGDGTKTGFCELTNITEGAKCINDFMLAFNLNTSGTNTEFVNVYTTSEEPDISENVAYVWDFNNPSDTGFTSGGYHSFATTNTGTSVNIVSTFAKTPDLTSAAGAMLTETTVNGESVYKVKKYTSGSISNPVSILSEKVSIATHPYLCVVARSDSAGERGISVYPGFGSNPVYTAAMRVSQSFYMTTDYKTYVLDLRPLVSGANGEYFAKMMFANITGSVISNEYFLYDVDKDGVYEETDGDFYYVKKPVTYQKMNNIEVDEMYFSKTNPNEGTPLQAALSLTASDDKITLDGGSVELKCKLFSNIALEDESVNYTLSDTNLARLDIADDGTVTLTALGNGTVVVTATAFADKNATDSVEIEISGQRKKTLVYDLKLMSIGNSYLRHGYNPNYSIWMKADEPLRGMAASDPELDYFHRIQYYLRTELNSKVTGDVFASSDTEAAWKKGLADSNDTTNFEGWDKEYSKNSIVNSLADRIEHLETEKPDIITIQLGENLKTDNYEVACLFYDTLYAKIKEHKPENSVVVIITSFSDCNRARAAMEYAKFYGFYVADMRDINSYSVVNPDNRYLVKDGVTYDRGNSGWKYNPYLAYAQYPGYDDLLGDGRIEFRSHPGDLGMDEIAKRVFAQLRQAIPRVIEAQYIYMPDSIEILGDDVISKETTLSVRVTLDDATDKVNWSVDDERIATIGADGTVTPVNNGTVTVKAVCAYDDTIFAERTFTVTGQTPCYTVSYSAGADDEVTGLPESDAYAKGEYTLSSIVPERTGYKFKGWTTEEGSEKTVKTVTADKNVTVYAVWEYADSWYFETDGDTEGISLGGFHGKVQNGIASVTSYEGGVSIYDSTLLVDAEKYSCFNTKLAISMIDVVPASLTLVLTTKDGEITYTKSIPDTLMNEYSFDISDVTGIITGFRLVPNCIDAALTVDYIEFERSLENVTGDMKLREINIHKDTVISSGQYLVTADKVNIHKDAVLTLGAGNYIFGEIDAQGTLAASGDANVVVTGTNKPHGYVEIDLGEKTLEANSRYVKAQGSQILVKEYQNKLGLIVSDSAVVTVAEVNENGETVKTQYFCAYNAPLDVGVENAQAVLALYGENGRYIGMQIKPVSAQNTVAVFNFDAEGVCSYKIMLFDSLGSLKPLSESVEESFSVS